jgi:hypothetical protein
MNLKLPEIVKTHDKREKKSDKKRNPSKDMVTNIFSECEDHDKTGRKSKKKEKQKVRRVRRTT